MKTILICLTILALIEFNAVIYSQCVGCTGTNPATLPAFNPGVKICITGDKTYGGDLDFNGGEIQVCSGSTLSLNGNVRINSGGIRLSGCSSVLINGSIINNNVGGIIVLDNCNCPEAVSHTGTFSGFPIVCGPLPVKLIIFEANIKNNNESMVEWTTTSEVNNSHFLLDISKDAVNWENITSVEGAGNSNEVINYTYSHKLSSAGTFYYRLTQVDYNGNKEVFDIISVTNNYENVLDAELLIYPNPATSILTVYLPIQIEEYSIEIMNVTGQIVSKKIVKKGGNTNKEIDVTSLKEGIYIINVSSTDYNKAVQLIVSK